MSFINQFYRIIGDPEVRAQANLLLEEGKGDHLFIDYFGVNFNQSDIVSVKLYFSFLSHSPSIELLKKFNIDSAMQKQIRDNWKSSNNFTYLHQGFTFGLKCYLKNNRIEINKYIHFRTKEFLFGFPKEVKLTEVDKQNYPGICVENHADSAEVKNYFYLSSPESKQEICNQFELNKNGIDIGDIDMVEYTESEREKKINLILPHAKSVESFLNAQNNSKIIELSNFFYKEFKLYYYGPGMRMGSDTRAIYFLPKELYYGLSKVNSIQNIFDSQIKSI